MIFQMSQSNPEPTEFDILQKSEAAAAAAAAALKHKPIFTMILASEEIDPLVEMMS
jgi:hypothetical protein